MTDKNATTVVIDGPDAVTEAWTEELRAVEKAARGKSDEMRANLDLQADVLRHKIAAQAARRKRPNTVPGDPYFRTIEEIDRESSRF